MQSQKDACFRCAIFFCLIIYLFFCLQVDGGIVLPDKASLHVTAIEDAEYKDDKIECEPLLFSRILIAKHTSVRIIFLVSKVFARS